MVSTKYEKVTAYQCPACLHCWAIFEDATGCCPRDIEEIEGYQCNDCGDINETTEDAELCYKQDKELE